MMMLVTVSNSQLSSRLLSNVDSVVYAYSNSQGQSFVNECGLYESSGINCVASGPQTQGDGSPTATPIVSTAGGKGEQGPLGPQGPAGPQGPPGPDKELVVDFGGIYAAEVPPHQSGSVISPCLDSQVVGGGHGLVGGLDQVSELTAFPDGSDNTWDVDIRNDGEDPVSIHSEAICAKLVDEP